MKRGAEVDHPDFDGISPLCVSALEGYCNVAKLLISAGADTGHWDRNGRTPLFAAAANGHKDIVDLLLTKAEGLYYTRVINETRCILLVKKCSQQLSFFSANSFGTFTVSLVEQKT